METDRIISKLFALQDQAYADFQSKLLPTVKRETVIGVRTPDLRKMAKQICKTPAAQEFLHSLPHRYFDENQLHAFILSEEKDFNTCKEAYSRTITAYSQVDEKQAHLYETLWHRDADAVFLGRGFPTGILRMG